MADFEALISLQVAVPFTRPGDHELPTDDDPETETKLQKAFYRERVAAAKHAETEIKKQMKQAAAKFGKVEDVTVLEVREA